MATPLTDAHHQWIMDVSGGAFDPAKYAPVNQKGGAQSRDGAERKGEEAVQSPGIAAAQLVPALAAGVTPTEKNGKSHGIARPPNGVALRSWSDQGGLAPVNNLPGSAADVATSPMPTATQTYGAAAPGEGKQPSENVRKVPIDWDKKQADYGTAAQIWSKRVAKMESDLQQLRKDMFDAFGGDDEGRHMEQELLKEVDGCLNTLDLSLHKHLEDLTKVETASAAQTIVEAARGLVEQHLKHVETDHFLQNVDENPSGITIRDQLVHSLTTIRGILTD